MLIMKKFHLLFLILVFSIYSISFADDLRDQQLAETISNAIDYTNSDVRDTAVSFISAANGGSYNIYQVCDIFDSVYKRWIYVNDPNTGYYSPASKSIKLWKGDCDDYAILMTALIHSIGGTVRIVCAEGNEKGSGHAYPELYMGNDEQLLKDLLESLSHRYKGKKMNYRAYKTENGQTKYWLNLDWSAEHPGGKFFKGKKDILLIYANGYYERTKLN